MQGGAKPAVQNRSRETRDRLLAAMDELLKERAFETIGIGDLAGRAGVSPATVYQRFANKDAAVAILIELYIRTVEAWSRSPKGKVDLDRAATLRDALVAVGLTACRQFDELGYLMRPAYLHSRLRPDLHQDLWESRQRLAVAGFERLLEAYAAEIAPSKLPEAAGVIAYFYNMMFMGRLLHGELRSASGAPSGARGFAEQLADFACGYLKTAGDPGRVQRKRRAPARRRP